MSYLVLVRHGLSTYNKENVFTGQQDVPLAQEGVEQARRAAHTLANTRFDHAFVSTLKRAHGTLEPIIQHTSVPITRTSALDERSYGELEGMNKDEARKRFGEQQVFIWRRSYGVKPPGGESLKDVYERAVPYFETHILPLVREGKNVLVVAHGNSLRAIIKYIEDITDQDIPHLEIATGIPLVYVHEDDAFTSDNHTPSFTRPVHWHEFHRA